MVTVVAQFTAKTTHSEKAIKFVSLMSCSTNKQRFHMLFKCKKRNFLLQEMVGIGGGGGGHWLWQMLIIIPITYIIQLKIVKILLTLE